VLDPSADEDGDGLSNGTEISGGTNPYQRDSDGDGVNDPMEIADGTDPNDANSRNHLSQGLLAYYPFSGDYLDKSGFANHLTPQGVELVADQNGFTSSAVRIQSGQYLLNNNMNFQLSENQDITILVWVRMDNYDHPYPAFVALSNEGATLNTLNFDMLRMGMIANRDIGNEFWVDHHFGRSSGNSLSSGYTLELGHWNQLGLTVSASGSIKLYVNGNLKAQEQKNFGAIVTQPTQLILGHSFPDFYFNGALDDLRIYGRVLSSSEIGQIYRSEAAIVTLIDWLGGSELTPDLVEKYVFGGAAGPNSPAEPVTTSLQGNELVLSVIVRTNDPNVTVWGEAATDLAGFKTPATPQIVPGTPAANQEGVPAGCQRQVFKMNADGLQRGFLRVRADIAN